MDQVDVREAGLRSAGVVVDWADAEGCITGDFVHYVIHVAARASGECCEICGDEAGKSSSLVS